MQITELQIFRHASKSKRISVFFILIALAIFGGVSNAQDHKSSHVVYETMIDSDSSECIRLQRLVHSLAQGNDNQKTYDTARYAIEHCANQFMPAFPIWPDFGAAGGGVQYMSDDKNRWPIYREWLKKVLYLNIDSFYYCADVKEILSTFQYFNAERGYDLNGSVALIKFLLDSHRCLAFFPDLNKIWKATREQQLFTYRDSVKDPTHSPLDTTIPSLEELDLQLLKGPQYGAVVNGFTPSSMKKINSVTASRNPFGNETTLLLDLNDDEYMKLELFDLLGNRLYSDSKLCIKGKNDWQLSGSGLPQSPLYARIATMGGEVMTIKLVHR